MSHQQSVAANGENPLNAAPMVDLYHRTDPDKADAIMSRRRFLSQEFLDCEDSSEAMDDGETYFLKSDWGHGYGSSCIHVRVPAHLVHEDDDMSFYGDGTEAEDDDKHYFVFNRDLRPEHIIGRRDDQPHG